MNEPGIEQVFSAWFECDHCLNPDEVEEMRKRLNEVIDEFRAKNKIRSSRVLFKLFRRDDYAKWCVNNRAPK